MSRIAELLCAHAGVDDGRSWLPLILRGEDEQLLAELLRGGRVSFACDTLQEQLAELEETREPTLDLPAEELARRARVHLGGVPPERYGSWVYYPWSRRLAHVLPEAEYRELRTSRNRNKITRAEQEALAQKRVGVVGLSVGQASAVTLAMEEVAGELVLADFDRLSLSNMNRLRSGVHNVGVNKAVLTAREIVEIDPYARLTVFTDGLTDANMAEFFEGGGGLDLLVEECDDLYMKIKVRERARALRIPVLMETSDRGLIDVERYDEAPSRPLLHGLAGDLVAERLRGLSTFDKVPIVLRLLGEETISSRLAASLVEVKTTLKTWPQLASAVALGSALNTDTARRILLGQVRGSGRFYADLEQLVREGASAPLAEFREDRPADEALAAPVAPALARGARVDADTARRLVWYGTMSFSGGNVQPWRFVFRDGTLRCIHDLERSRSFLDWHHAATHLAFGGVVENISLAASQLGLEAQVATFPVPDDPFVVCDLTFAHAATPRRREDPDLFARIPQRVTNRRLGERAPFVAEDGVWLAGLAEEAGARLEVLASPAALDGMGAVLGRGDRVRFLHQVMHREMMSELRWSREEVERTRDGMDVVTLDLSASDLAGMRVTRAWRVMEAVGKLGGGRGLEKPAKKSMAAASAVGLLTTQGTQPLDYFRAGRALARVWLGATSRGWAMQPMTALTYLFARLVGGDAELAGEHRAEIAELHRRYLEIFRVPSGWGDPMLFRLARVGPPRARSLRRHVEDVLEVQ